LRNTLCFALTLLLVAQLIPAALGAESVAYQITAMPDGAKIKLRLNNKQEMQGVRGVVSATGFTLVDARTGEHQIAFDDIASVKLVTKKSHLTRNILIGIGIGSVVLGLIAKATV
jgi:hypothetical protein